MLDKNWAVFRNIDDLSQQLANDILRIAKQSIKLSNSFKIVLTGGGSVVNLYKILRCSKSDWSKWNVYIGDERCLPLQNKGRNDYVINDVWLNNGLIPKKNINFIKAELGGENGAYNYEKVLKSVVNFDIVLLSIGEDGHVASLFPGHYYDDNKSVVFERNSPKFPKERISMSYSRLNQAENIFKIVSGISKKDAVESWLQERSLPINQINGFSEKVYICQDALP